MMELSLQATAASAESVSDALLDEFGALSVSIEDADAGTLDEHAVFGEPGMAADEPRWQRSVVKALFSDADAAAAAATGVLAALGDEVRLQALQPLADQDWVRLTQAQFAPIEVVAGFWVVPSWHEVPLAAKLAIRLDPGMAFGTGTHPTTRMCLRWLARLGMRPGAAWGRVLDYGCGSGILAIAAALHGAAEVDAVDIDAEAVAATRANAQANGIPLHAGDPSLARGAYRLILANILATPLKLLAPLLCRHLDDEADLVLAGILERQADEIAEAYAPWVRLRVEDREEGWILMSGHYAAGAAGE